MHSSSNASENWAQIDSLSSEKADGMYQEGNGNGVVYNETVGYDSDLNDDDNQLNNTLQDFSPDNPLMMELGQREGTIHLTLRILNTIASSVERFHPSKSLAYIHSQSDKSGNEAAMTEIDVVISGGGFKGLFMAGSLHILTQSTLCKRKLVIQRISGASAGAWAGLFCCCGFELHHWLKTYYACKDRPSNTVHEVYHDLIPWVKEHMAPDAYLLCSGKLFISITFLTYNGLQNRIISTFISNDDLIQAPTHPANVNIPSHLLQHPCVPSLTLPALPT